MRGVVLAALLVACQPSGELKVGKRNGDTGIGASSTGTGTETGTATGTTGSGTGTVTGGTLAQDYSAPGAFGVDEYSGDLVLPACSGSLSHFSYVPQSASPAAAVIVPTWEDPSTEAGLARHWASWGLAVLVIGAGDCLGDLNSEAISPHLIGLADTVAPGIPRVWAGVGNGALTALVASTQDSEAVGHFGSDLFDSASVGVDHAPDVDFPAYGLAAEPNFICNRNNNGSDVYALIADSKVFSLVGAGHCDLLDPPDASCLATCADGTADPAVVREAIRGMSTGFLLWTTGLDPAGEQWWLPGYPFHEDLLAEGTIASP